MKKLLAGFVLILCASCPGMAQRACSVYTFYGTLIIPARNYPPTFEVLLLSYRGEQTIAFSYVDGTNRFRFDALPTGRFDVVVRLEGFKELRETVDIGMPLDSSASGCNMREIFWLLPIERVDERLIGYPQEAIAEYDLGIRADNTKQFDEAVKHLEKVVLLAADWFEAHCDLATLYEKLNRPGDAESEYRKALVLKPDSVRGLMSLGRLLLDEADRKLQDPQSVVDVKPSLREAHVLLANAIKRDSKSAMAWYLLGDVDFRLADYKASETELKRALELDATLFPARLTLINVFVMQKLWQDALDEVDTFLLENPNSPVRRQVSATRASLIRRLQSTP